MELLERERFLAELAAALTRVGTGTGHTVLVSGEAGIGKTALIEHFTGQHRQTTRILWGGCEALFTPRPLGPLRDIAQQTEADLLALLDAEAPRASIFSAFLRELQSSAHPTVAVLEDIHWADEATLDLTKFLGRRIHRTRALLILTYRDDELGAHHPLRAVLGDLPGPTVTRLGLPPLSDAAVRSLAQRAGRSAEGLHTATGGNPFFVTEVLASGEGDVPPTVRDAVLARAARLSPAARDVVELAAVVPTRMERWLLDRVLAPASSALDECAEAGTLKVDEGTLSFRHELARRALEEALPPARLQALHAQVLRVLEDRPASDVDVARLVHHASHAGDGAAVLQFAPMAARQASALGAHRQAAAHYAAALRHAVALPLEDRAELLDGHSYECHLFGEMEEALRSREAALRIWRQLGSQEKEGQSLRWLSRLNYFLGRTREARDYAAQAVELLEALPPGSELAMAYSNRAQLHMLALETTEAVRWGAKAIELARKLRDHETLVHALHNVGMAEYLAGDDRGRAKLEENLRLALEDGFEEHAARAFNNLVATAVRDRDYARAERYLVDGIIYCTDRDLDSWSLNLRAWRSRVNFDRGRWAEAVEEATAVLMTHGLAAVHKIQALTVLGHVRVRRGDPGAVSFLDEARDLAAGMGELHRIAPAAAARAETAWLRAKPQDTLAEARDAFELARDWGHPWVLGELALWMWRAGGLTEPPPGAAEPYTLQIARDWRAAADAWERIGCPYERAMALADGDEKARKAALGILDGLGAAPAAEIVRRGLKAQGVRDIPRGPRAATRSNPAGLTARELEVLALLAKGLQNVEIAARLFVSAKTVDHHISAILAKLNVRSRKQAVAAASRLGIIPESPY